MTTPIFTAAERDRIAAAVAAAEAHADAEVVPVVAHQSDRYGDVALAWSAGVAGFALLVVMLINPFYLALVDGALGLWNHHWPPRDVMMLALVIACGKFGGMWVMLLWRRLRLLLVPGLVKAARVRAAAHQAFHLTAQGRTSGATGVVIYLSLAERRADIVPDAAIAAKIAPEAWGDAMHAMLDHFRADRVADGLIAGIAAVGAVLATHVPRDSKPANELPDGPIEL
jgi:putative membrane protein